MAHDFLTSLHSQVMVVGEEQRRVKPADQPLNLQPRKRGRVAITAGDRHRTIGVSMPPELRDRAGERAAAVGLSFSRYVQWCIEAELDGAPLASRFRQHPGPE